MCVFYENIDFSFRVTVKPGNIHVHRSLLAKGNVHHFLQSFG